MNVPYFKIDKAVKTGAASWCNYKNSGYDRGHLCPAGIDFFPELEDGLEDRLEAQNDYKRW